MLFVVVLWAIAFLPIALAAALHFGLRAHWTAWLLGVVAVLEAVWLGGVALWLADYRGIGGICESAQCDEPAEGFKAVFEATIGLATVALVLAGAVAVIGLAVAAARR